MNITVCNKRTHNPQPNDYYIGRGSAFGNPFTHIPSGTKAQFVVKDRDTACEEYKAHFEHNVVMQTAFESLVLFAIEHNWNINLVCYCAPLRCHGDFIRIKLLERKQELLSIR